MIDVRRRSWWLLCADAADDGEEALGATGGAVDGTGQRQVGLLFNRDADMCSAGGAGEVNSAAVTAGQGGDLPGDDHEPPPLMPALARCLRISMAWRP